MSTGFNELLAAQVAAFFADKQGGEVPVLKLIKLIYLSDRESMSSHGYPITNDQFVSMPHGPVNSLTLSYVDGNYQSPAWSSLISSRANNSVGLVKKILRDDLDELSDADIQILEIVWEKFGDMSKYQIRDWTHEHCPEWEDPNGSCMPIPHERVLRYLEIECASEFASEINSQRQIELTFAQLKE
jgi:uncharacterized phage-associated protein